MERAGRNGGEARPIEEVFTRYTCVLHLTVAGETIRTTGEHPFWSDRNERGLGWAKASELIAGDRLLSSSGEWLTIDRVEETGQDEVVYNCRVAEWHTYFVGDDGWGWAVWAHNVYIAFGVSNGLASFARKHNAKWYKEWKGERFGYQGSTGWDPENLGGGTSSPFATAVRYAISGAEKIYFNLAGFNLSYWYPASKGAGPVRFAAVEVDGIEIGSTTAWELEKLVANEDTHHKTFFVDGSNLMNFLEFRQHVVHTLAPLVRAENAANPNWATEIAKTRAIGALVVFFEMTDQEIDEI